MRPLNIEGRLLRPSTVEPRLLPTHVNYLEHLVAGCSRTCRRLDREPDVRKGGERIEVAQSVLIVVGIDNGDNSGTAGRRQTSIRLPKVAGDHAATGAPA